MKRSAVSGPQSPLPTASQQPIQRQTPAKFAKGLFPAESSPAELPPSSSFSFGSWTGLGGWVAPSSFSAGDPSLKTPLLPEEEEEEVDEELETRSLSGSATPLASDVEGELNAEEELDASKAELLALYQKLVDELELACVLPTRGGRWSTREEVSQALTGLGCNPPDISLAVEVLQLLQTKLLPSPVKGEPASFYEAAAKAAVANPHIAILLLKPDESYRGPPDPRAGRSMVVSRARLGREGPRDQKLLMQLWNSSSYNGSYGIMAVPLDQVHAWYNAQAAAAPGPSSSSTAAAVDRSWNPHAADDPSLPPWPLGMIPFLIEFKEGGREGLLEAIGKDDCSLADFVQVHSSRPQWVVQCRVCQLLEQRPDPPVDLSHRRRGGGGRRGRRGGSCRKGRCHVLHRRPLHFRPQCPLPPLPRQPQAGVLQCP